MPTRRTYTREFKEEAVRLAEQHGYAQTGRDLGVDRSLIRKWKNKLEEHGQQAFPGKGNPHEAELAQQMAARLLEKGVHEVLALAEDKLATPKVNPAGD